MFMDFYDFASGKYMPLCHRLTKNGNSVVILVIPMEDLVSHSLSASDGNFNDHPCHSYGGYDISFFVGIRAVRLSIGDGCDNVKSEQRGRNQFQLMSLSQINQVILSAKNTKPERQQTLHELHFRSSSYPLSTEDIWRMLSLLSMTIILQTRLNKEQEEREKRRKEKLEARLYTIIKVARDEDLGRQIGKEIYFDLVNHDNVPTFRILKRMPFTQFKEIVAKTFGIPVRFQRYWLWLKRKNHTYRPHRALTAQEEIYSVDQLREQSNTVHSAELKLFLEVELCLDRRPLSSPGKTKEETLLFFKFHDPLKEKIRYVGRLFVKESGMVLEILSELKELAGFSPDEEIDLFEEIKFEPSVCCEQIDSMLSFRDYQLVDGDIICFQKSLRNQCTEKYRFPLVPLFLEYMHNHQARAKKEQEEMAQKGKEKAEACLYTTIKVARDADLGEQIGREIYFDLVDHDKVCAFRIQKQMPFTKFKEEVANAVGIPVEFQRYWVWAKRQNHTYRPYRALTSQDEIKSVGQLSEESNTVNNELKLFLEVEFCLDLRSLSSPGRTKEEILLFFKLYDPLEENIRYVGRLFVKLSSKPLMIIAKLKAMAGFSSDEEIELFEEIRFEPNVMCVQINRMLTFRDCKLYDGDIVCFQKSLRNQSSEQYRFPYVPSFLEYVHKHQQNGHQQLVPTSGFPTESPWLVEANTLDDPSSARFTWIVDNFSMLTSTELYSNPFYLGGYQWRILIGGDGDRLSIFLELANAAELPYGWCRYTQLSLAVLDQIDDSFTVRRDTQLQFNANMVEWGFTSFMPLTQLYDPERGYIVDDKVIFEAYVTLPRSFI